MRRLVAAILMSTALAACDGSTSVTSEVTRTHTLASVPTGQTFLVVPLDRDQEQSPAFKTYAARIATTFKQLGLRQGISPEDAAKVWQNPADYPGGDIPPPRPPDYTITLKYGVREPGADIQAEIDIYKGNTYDTPNKERVFEAHAVSTGQKGKADTAMPYVIDALLKDFPGRSGETQRVSIPIAEQAPKSDQAAAQHEH